MRAVSTVYVIPVCDEKLPQENPHDVPVDIESYIDCGVALADISMEVALEKVFGKSAFAGGHIQSFPNILKNSEVRIVTISGEKYARG